LKKLNKLLFSCCISTPLEVLFASVKPSDSSRTLDQIATDIHTFIDRFSSIEAVEDMSTFKHLVRLFKEQCLVEEADENTSEYKAGIKSYPFYFN